MARIDKYDPVDGGFRAPLAADYAGSASPIGVGLNSSGRVVPGAGQTGVLGVICIPRALKAGNIVDIMTDGELVEFNGVAGTTYFAHAGTGAISTTASAYRVGATVEATRLVVRMGAVGAVTAGAEVTGDQPAIADLNQTISNPPTQAEVQAISDKVDDILAALRTAGLLTP